MADVVSGSGESGTGASSAPAAASPAVTPGTSASTAVAPTAQPQGDGSPVGSEPKGPIPFERHDEIVKGFHKKLDALKWAESVDQKTFEEMRFWYEHGQRDPAGFTRKALHGLANTPALRSQFESLMQEFQQQQRQASPPEPEPDLIAENGQPVYSAPQLRKWQEWNNAKQRAEIQDIVSPLLQKEQMSQMQAEVEAKVKRTIEQHKDLPAFEELKPQIAKYMHADKRLSLLGAYTRAYNNDYKPRMAQAQQEALFQKMNEKAAVNTANPNAAAATPKSPRDMTWEEWLPIAMKKR